MRIAGVYSFKGGEQEVTRHYPDLLAEVNEAIKVVEPARHKTRQGSEKTTMGRMPFSPASVNKSLKKAFSDRGWKSIRVPCVFPNTHYAAGYQPRKTDPGAFRELDFVKGRLGVEVQFGKYAFMVYNVCAKMTIFHKLGFIDHGVEIVPVKAFAEEMPSGVSYFEQFVWGLETRGAADIDIPVLILGLDA